MAWTTQNGVVLFCPLSYQRASKMQKEAVCNGCGAANAKFDFVPDTIYGLSINDACNIHDWMYHVGRTIEDKQEADRVFLNNMLRIIEHKGGWLKILRRMRAIKYYGAVADMGGPAFWDGKEKAA